MKYSINDLKNFAESKDGKCLSLKYIRSSTKYIWLCSKRHQWSARWNSILSKGTWCPWCSNRARKTIQDMKVLACSRGGICVSEVYVNWKTKIEWQCAMGHRWFARPNSIQQGSWCPNCSLHYSEEKTRYVFEKLFKCPFPKNRTVLGNKQELDGFNADLRIAFEYDGEPHYKYIPIFHKNIRNFQKRLQQDDIKNKKCENLGINLIRIKGPLKDDSLVGLICDKLKIPYQNISFIDFYRKLSPMSVLGEIVNQRGGRILTPEYNGSKSLMEFQCQLGHTWKTQANHIKDGRWCPHCARNARLSIEKVSALAEKNNCICISKVYKNARSPLGWKCKKCNIIWSMPYDQVKHRWCLQCSTRNKNAS